MKRLAVCMLVLAVGCAQHISPYKPKRRTYDPGPYGKATGAETGSLYSSMTVGFYEDMTAVNIGDILVIRIDERDLATRRSDTRLDKSDETTYGMPNALGFASALAKKYPDADLSKLFASTSEQKFTGNGAVARQGQLSATLPVRVRQVLSNGDLFVEGTKVVMVGNEEQHIYVSGVVRRIDIDEQNTVPSSRVADAEIEYTGRGDVSDTQRRGWLGRAMSKLWPF